MTISRRGNVLLLHRGHMKCLTFQRQLIARPNPCDQPGAIRAAVRDPGGSSVDVDHDLADAVVGLNRTIGFANRRQRKMPGIHAGR